jgi:CheY-like chemotaxis protein
LIDVETEGSKSQYPDLRAKPQKLGHPKGFAILLLKHRKSWEKLTMKTLAISNDPHILELIATVAVKIRFPEVIAAPSIEDALVALAETALPFDCLILDIGMQVDVVTKCCTCVRNIPAYRKIPIIALAATEERPQLEAVLRAGATDYVSKPVDSFELGTRLRAAEVMVNSLEEPSSPVHLNRDLNDVRVLVDLSDEIAFEGVEKLVNFEELANHLVQLSPAGLQSSQVVAFKIDQIEAIFARSSPAEFLYALSETANAIGEVFKVYSYYMAYAGRGIFVVVSNKAHLEPSIIIEDETQSILDERFLEFDDGTPLNINVSVGNPVRPTITLRRRITNTVNRAIARAENRSERKNREVPSVDHPLCRFRSIDRRFA